VEGHRLHLFREGEMKKAAAMRRAARAEPGAAQQAAAPVAPARAPAPADARQRPPRRPVKRSIQRVLEHEAAQREEEQLAGIQRDAEPVVAMDLDVGPDVAVDVAPVEVDAAAPPAQPAVPMTRKQRYRAKQRERRVQLQQLREQGQAPPEPAAGRADPFADIYIEMARSGNHVDARPTNARDALERTVFVISTVIGAIHFSKRMNRVRWNARLKHFRAWKEIAVTEFGVSYKQRDKRDRTVGPMLPPTLAQMRSGWSLHAFGNGMLKQGTEGIHLRSGLVASSLTRMYSALESPNSLVCWVSEHRTSITCPGCHRYCPATVHPVLPSAPAGAVASQHGRARGPVASPSRNTKSDVAGAADARVLGRRAGRHRSSQTDGPQQQRSVTHHCTNAACPAHLGGRSATTWAHDEIGFRNILRVTLAACNGEPRPADLSVLALGPSLAAAERRAQGKRRL
jgi:hypothetical protein